MNEVFIFLAIFSILIILGSLFVMGFYVVTRHYKTDLPDGSIKIEGKILKEWSLFWEQVKEWKPIYYQQDYIMQKFILLEKTEPSIANKLQVSEYDTCLEVLDGNELTAEEIYTIEEVLECNVFKKEEVLFLFKTYPVYRFNDLIRLPISACTPCMSSVFGSIFYWGMFLILNNCINFNAGLSLWVSLWIPYVIIISFLNKIIDDKLKL